MSEIALCGRRSTNWQICFGHVVSTETKDSLVNFDKTVWFLWSLKVPGCRKLHSGKNDRKFNTEVHQNFIRKTYLSGKHVSFEVRRLHVAFEIMCNKNTGWNGAGFMIEENQIIAQKQTTPRGAQFVPSLPCCFNIFRKLRDFLHNLPMKCARIISSPLPINEAAIEKARAYCRN